MIHKSIQLYKKIPRRVITLLFLAAIIAFLILYLKGTDFSRLEHLDVNWLLVIIGTLWALLFRYWMVVIWCAILRALGSKQLPPFEVMAHVYAKAWITRYVPGTVTWIAGKIYMAASYGISKSRLAVSSTLEGGMQVAATTTASLFILGFSPHLKSIPFVARAVVVAMSVACLAILFPPVFNRLLHTAHVVLKKQKPSEELRTNGRAVITSFLLFIIGTFIIGTASYFIVLAIAPHGSIDWYFYIVGAFGISGAIGIATPFLPSGIGVRDGVLLILLSAIMPKEIALTITVFSRLWQVAADVIFLGMAAFQHKFFPKEASPQ